MKKNNMILKLEVLLVLLLGTCTFFRFTSNKVFIAFLLLFIAIGLGFLLKGEKILKVDKKKILRVMIIFAVLYLALFYMLGIYTGFVKATNQFGIKTIFNYIVPITIIIICTEYIRKKLLINESYRSKALVVILTTFIDVLLYINLYDSSSLDSFLILVGFVAFAAVANNLLYNFICTRYGIKPIITYKLIITLYVYIIPYVPDVYIYFRTFVRMLFPLIIYLYLDKYYNKDMNAINKKEAKTQIASLAIGVVLITAIIMLISCKFYYGILVIGSDSMSKTIEKGDAVFFVADKDSVHEKDVIVFNRKDVKIVHRVVKKVNINDGVRYYTKGDANKELDDFYTEDKDLIGKVIFKVKYIGKPTLWLRNVFDKEG